MSDSRLSKNDRVTARVLARRQFTKKSIYEVEFNGRRFHVPMFEFQKQLPLPDEIECVVQSVDGDNLYLVQNIANLLREQYRVGETYEFVITEDYTRASTPHYKLTDGSGFYFKLTPPAGVPLAKNNKVRCRLRKLRNIEVDLEFLGRVHQVNAGFNVGTLVRRIGLDALRLLNLYRREPGAAEIAEMYTSGSPDWLPASVEYVIERLGAVGRSELQPAHLESARALCRVMVWLLEDSDYFDNFNDDDRRRQHERFRRDLSLAGALAEAMDVIMSGGASEYVERVLSKIKASGYLIDAEQRLRVIRNIFAIDRDLLSQCIGSVLSVAQSRRAGCMAESAFRRAFVELLQIYVDSNRAQLDTMDEAETPAAREQTSVMIRVIALQLLMADDASDEFDYRLNRSRLYRYLTLYAKGGEETLFEKSLNALTACETWRNEHAWRDLEQMLALTTCLRQSSAAASLPAVYDTAQAVLKVSPGDICVEESAGAGYGCESLERMGLWKGLRVRLGTALPVELRNPRTVQQFKRMW
ncbi:MAG: hypothetical protein NC201_01930, partial [Prevotella sp.]|nr:hypothetical protein [Prevotella sp.]